MFNPHRQSRFDLILHLSGFHNLRHSLSSFLITKRTADLPTVQDTLRHGKPDMRLGSYTKSTMKSRIAAQQQVLDAILPSLVSVCLERTPRILPPVISS
jgi:integrase